jgi:DNA invertase Pin-like site-specific DNA recombinase
VGKRKPALTDSPKTIGYLRVSTDRQDLNNQKHEILVYAQKTGLMVKDFIGVEISSSKGEKERRIDELLSRLTAGDTVIISELPRLGRSTLEVLGIIDRLIQRRINLIAIKQNLNINGKNDMTTKVMTTLFSLFAELERDLLSDRTKQALARKRAEGVVLGRPKGVPGKSKLDEKHDDIKRLYDKKVSVSSLAKIFDVSWPTMENFLRKKIRGTAGVKGGELKEVRKLSQ